MKATAIWALFGAMRTTQAISTATGGMGNQIAVAATAGFAAGDWVHVLHAGGWEHYGIVGVNATTGTLTLDANLRQAVVGGEIVRTGYWREIDKEVMLTSFEQRASLFGGAAAHGAMLGPNSHFYNSMVMRFTLTPPGMGDVIVNHPESGVVPDITRQKEWRNWMYSSPTAGATLIATDSFPGGEIPNDDGPNAGQRDEDNDPFPQPVGGVGDDVFVRDMPGRQTQNTGGNFRFVQRMNLYEFVRIRLDGKPFANVDGQIEGSRASDKRTWHSRIDLIDDGTGVWKRNPTAPPNGNTIGLDHINLGAPP